MRISSIDELTNEMIREHFPGAYTDPVTVDLETQLDCYRADGSLQTRPEMRKAARMRIADVINAKIGA